MTETLPQPASARVTAAAVVPPAIGVLFWTTKILTTGAGEVTSDYLGRSAFPIVQVGIAGLLFVGALVAQFRRTTYSTTVYWLAALMISVFGTSIADIVHVVLGVPYYVSTTTFAVLLGVLLTSWYRSEGTLALHSINSRRRQGFYWATVMCTFSLGTAAGDMFATNLHLGYFVPGVLFAAMMLVPLIGWRLGLNSVAAFWTAYILTRPLGASFADWASVKPVHGGLGFGPGPVAAVLMLAIAAVLVVGEVLQRRSETAGFVDTDGAIGFDDFQEE